MLFSYIFKVLFYPLLKAILPKDNRLVVMLKNMIFYSEIYEILIQAYIIFLLASLLNFLSKSDDPDNNLVNGVYVVIMLFVLLLGLPLIILYVIL